MGSVSGTHFAGPRAGKDALTEDGTFRLPEFEKRLVGHSNCRLVSVANDQSRLLWLFVKWSGFLILYAVDDFLALLSCVSKRSMRQVADGMKYANIKLLTVLSYFNVLL